MIQCLNWSWGLEAGGKTSVSSKPAFSASHNSQFCQNYIMIMIKSSHRTATYFTLMNTVWIISSEDQIGPTAMSCAILNSLGRFISTILFETLCFTEFLVRKLCNLHNSDVFCLYLWQPLTTIALRWAAVEQCYCQPLQVWNLSSAGHCLIRGQFIGQQEEEENLFTDL